MFLVLFVLCSQGVITTDDAWKETDVIVPSVSKETPSPAAPVTDRYEVIQKFFTPSILADMSDYDKDAYVNQVNKYNNGLNLGLLSYHYGFFHYTCLLVYIF